MIHEPKNHHKLWEYFAKNHSLILLESELEEIAYVILTSLRMTELGKEPITWTETHSPLEMK